MKVGALRNGLTCRSQPSMIIKRSSAFSARFSATPSLCSRSVFSRLYSFICLKIASFWNVYKAQPSARFTSIRLSGCKRTSQSTYRQVDRPRRSSRSKLDIAIPTLHSDIVAIHKQRRLSLCGRQRCVVLLRGRALAIVHCSYMCGRCQRGPGHGWSCCGDVQHWVARPGCGGARIDPFL
jgi:hypothetical protein